MKYFTIKRSFFLVPSLDVLKEYEKIDKFMNLLRKTGIAEIVKNGRQNTQLFNDISIIKKRK